jgi:hypothetical protein
LPFDSCLSYPQSRFQHHIRRPVADFLDVMDHISTTRASNCVLATLLERSRFASRPKAQRCARIAHTGNGVCKMFSEGRVHLTTATRGRRGTRKRIRPRMPSSALRFCMQYASAAEVLTEFEKHRAPGKIRSICFDGTTIALIVLEIEKATAEDM